VPGSHDGFRRGQLVSTSAKLHQLLSPELDAFGIGEGQVKLAIIGALVLWIVGSFLYLAGWLSPGRLTPRRFVDGFQAVNGIHPGFRRNHAKGVCIAGYFESNGRGVHLSKASVLRPGRVPVLGRFSLNGGQPYAGDEPASVRGLGLSFQPREGQEWRMAMVDLPVFVVRTPQGFYQQLLASKVDSAATRIPRTAGGARGDRGAPT
jgi:catalase